jgi:hypothetical protein
MLQKVEVVSERAKRLLRQSALTQEDFEAQLRAALTDFEAHGHDPGLIARIDAEGDEETGEICFGFIMKAT